MDTTAKFRYSKNVTKKHGQIQNPPQATKFHLMPSSIKTYFIHIHTVHENASISVSRENRMRSGHTTLVVKNSVLEFKIDNINR